MPLSRPLAGALAGLAATAPMSLAMVVMERFLPLWDRYPLPPTQITGKISRVVGLRQHMDRSQRDAAVVVAHFAYGTLAGTLFPPVARTMRLSPVLRGVVFGIAVWTGSYLGWLPALGVLRPATEHPARRTALMITAHVIWGAVTGVLYERFRSVR